MCDVIQGEISRLFCTHFTNIINFSNSNGRKDILFMERHVEILLALPTCCNTSWTKSLFYMFYENGKKRNILNSFCTHHYWGVLPVWHHKQWLQTRGSPYHEWSQLSNTHNFLIIYPIFLKPSPLCFYDFSPFFQANCSIKGLFSFKPSLANPTYSTE